MHLLLVEDDAMLAEAICDGARQNAWRIDHVGDAPAANLVLIDRAYTAVLLDAACRGIGPGRSWIPGTHATHHFLHHP